MSRERGVSLVEVAIALPLFLAGIFLVIWIGYMLNVTSSFVTSATRAVRLSVTRGNPLNFEDNHIITKVGEWLESGNPFPSDARVQELLSHNLETWNDAQYYYECASCAPSPDKQTTYAMQEHLVDLDPEYTYMLIYMYEGMRMSVGDSIRYPCNPENSDGSGCLRCVFLNPETAETEPGGSATISQNAFGFECHFQPDHGMMQPVINMLNLITGDSLDQLLVLDHKIYMYR